MTWYLIATTSKHIRPFPGHDKERGEWAVERQLRHLGCDTICPVRIDFKRAGKRRYADPVRAPYLPGYVFAEIPAETFTRAANATGAMSSFMAVTPQEMRNHVRPFFAACEEEREKAEAIIARNDRAAMLQFTPGQAVEILQGPFAGRVATFMRLVMAADFPRLECEMDIFGAKLPIEVDPLFVGEAG